MKIYRIGCFTLGFLFGFSNLNIVRTAMYAQIGLLLIDKISRCNFQNLSSQINCIPNLKRNFNKVVQKSIEIYPHVKEKFIFIFGTPSEEERIRKGKEWMAGYIQLLKDNNSKDFNQIEKLKEFIRNDPELLTSYTNSLKNTIIFVKPFESYLEVHEDELTDLCNQSSFFYDFKMDFKTLLRQNPDFLQLLQIKLMQQNLNKLMLEWIEEPKCTEIENEITILQISQKKYHYELGK